MKKFIIEYKEELVMMFLAFVGSSMFGIFALSHLYGAMNVLLSIFLGLLVIALAGLLYYKYLANRVYTFTLTQMKKLSTKLSKMNKPSIRKKKTLAN